MSDNRFIREPERRHTTSIAKVTWWQLEREGKVPARIKLPGHRIVLWRLSEIREWMDSVASGKQWEPKENSTGR